MYQQTVVLRAFPARRRDLFSITAPTREVPDRRGRMVGCVCVTGEACREDVAAPGARETGDSIDTDVRCLPAASLNAPLPLPPGDFQVVELSNRDQPVLT